MSAAPRYRQMLITGARFTMGVRRIILFDGPGGDAKIVFPIMLMTEISERIP